VRDENGSALLELHDARQLIVQLKPGQCVKRAQRLIEQAGIVANSPGRGLSPPLRHAAGEL